jgi:predicted membrane-bound mannosyltransferase
MSLNEVMAWSTFEKISVLGMVIASAWYISRLFIRGKKAVAAKTETMSEDAGVPQFVGSSGNTANQAAGDVNAQTHVHHAPVINNVTYNYITQIVSQEEIVPIGALQASTRPHERKNVRLNPSPSANRRHYCG